MMKDGWCKLPKLCTVQVRGELGCKSFGERRRRRSSIMATEGGYQPKQKQTERQSGSRTQYNGYREVLAAPGHRVQDIVIDIQIDNQEKSLTEPGCGRLRRVSVRTCRRRANERNTFEISTPARRRSRSRRRRQTWPCSSPRHGPCPCPPCRGPRSTAPRRSRRRRRRPRRSPAAS